MLTQHEQRCHQQFRLAASDRDITYEWYKNRVEERVEGTCLWFLEHEHFQGWLKQNSGPLLVTADPGCGKSVLARYLIDHGLPRSAAISYFFFKDEDQNTARQMLCALLHQLFSQNPALIKHAMRQYEEDGESLTNSTDSLWKILRSSVRDPQAGSVIIVLDALDECAQTEFEPLVRNIETQFHSNDPGNAKLRYLLTCRPYEQLVSRFSNLLGVFPNIHIPGEENSETISQEVNRVITHRVHQLPNTISPEIKSHLEERLHLTSHRTYLWVYLVFDHLKEGSFKKTRKGVDSAISNLPRSVNEAYEQILNRSNAEEHQMVRKVLSIVVAANQPLTLKELNIATNIDYETKSLEDIDLEDEDDFKKRIRSWCGLFILISQGHVYFLHQTAREFLIANSSSTSPVAPFPTRKWEHSITTQSAQAVLAELCVLYLALAHPEVIPAADEHNDMVKFMDQQPFFVYSALNWGAHFRHADIAEDAAVIPLVLRISDSSAKSYMPWFKMYWGITHDSRTPQFSHLMIAAYYGHHLTVRLLLKKGANLNSKDDMDHRTPLHWAAFNGHEETVELLIDKGADLESKDSDGATPLLLAAGFGYEVIAKMLIEKGADLNSKDSEGQTPISTAVLEGHEAVAKLLIEKGAELNSKDPDGETPLLVAAREGKETIFNLLLVAHGVDVEVKDTWGRTPLSYVAMAGHDAMVKALISNKRSEIDGEDSYGSTPLSLAARHNRMQVTERLLGTGRVDPNSPDHSGRTPLWYAKRYANPFIVQLLLEHARNTDISSDMKVFPTPGIANTDFTIVESVIRAFFVFVQTALGLEYVVWEMVTR
ncbi:unnamed protein product, partial [Clonostachys rosea f. rosea IK726]